MNVTIPKGTINDKTGDDFVGRNTVLNETVNTEAFSSPKSELVTSSPHAFSLSNDAGIINVSFSINTNRPFAIIIIIITPIGAGPFDSTQWI